MFRSITASIPRKMVAIILAVTFAALVVAASALLVYDLRTYRDARIDELRAQAEVIGAASVAALAFNDRKAAQHNVELLTTHARVTAAAIYTRDGVEFAAVANEKTPVQWPAATLARGYRIADRHIVIAHPIEQNGEVRGTVYLRGAYEWVDRVTGYLAILGTVMLLSLGVAVLLSFRLQRVITNPLLEVSRSAREVIANRDFSQKVEKTTHDEIGYVIDAFNAMLAEVGKRTAELQSADRRKDEFLATLAHELRNPLAPLRNALELQRLRGNDPTMLERSREIMERQLSQMVHLVNDLLDISRITTGRIELKRERIELRAMLDNALETVAALKRSRRQEISVSIPDEPVYLDGDGVRLAQVFVNLLNNAIKYTPSEGRIEVAARLEGNGAVIEISDNGIGIAQDMLPAIFEMFTQVDRSLEQSRGGLGIGLALTRRLVELHGGTISAHSEGPGRGSRFTVRLPVIEEKTMNLVAESDDALPLPPQRVLVVDDNRDYTDSMVLVLEAMGSEAHVAYDGESGLALAQRIHPQIAFLDIGLPGINGYELASRIRAMPEARDCMLVAVSGWGQNEDRARSRRAGFDRHFLKPIDPAQVKAILKENALAFSQRGRKAEGSYS